jgi:undecaprenyl-diphosphatase
MEVISKIILGIIQGITEIIPVSSSGHLILVSKLTGFELDLAFLTFLHLMTGLAIIWGFWDEIKYVFSSKQRSSLIKILFFAILPAILAGIFFHDYIENTLHNPFITISSLIGFGVLMIFVDSFFSDKGSIKKLEDVKARNAFLVGLAQIIALIPGTSRSGITIVSGIMTGIEKRVAVAFSFLIGLPLIIGSFFFLILKEQIPMENVLKEENLLGGLASFIFAYLTIIIFKKLLHTKFLTMFGVYRILLGLFIAISITI